jgi:hypothetical protein
LFEATKELARREGKVPVLMLADKGKPGFLVVVESSDLPTIVAKYAAANAGDGLESAIRRAYLRQRGELPEGDAPEAAGDRVSVPPGEPTTARKSDPSPTSLDAS